MRVLALTKYGLRAASTRQRFAQFAPYLEERGVSLTISPLIDDKLFSLVAVGKRIGLGGAMGSYARRLRALATSRDFDLLWVHCELFPYLPGLAELLGFAPRRPVVFDYDDAIFHMYDQHPNRLVRTLLRRKLAPLLRKAEVAICGNEYIRAYAAQYCRRTELVPTVVDTEVYRPAGSDRRPASGGPVVGWIGSPSTWRDVEPLLPDILPVLRKHGATLRVIGAGPRAVGIDGVSAVDWTEAGEVPEIGAMDVGIMPLGDFPFQRGKCGYKLIQYMACEVPVVASPVGVNREIVESSGGGLLADTAGQWGDALSELLANPDRRRSFGAAGRRAVVERYSLARHAPRILHILRSAASRRLRLDPASQEPLLPH